MLYAELTSPEIARLAPDSVAVLPLAAVEQHGDHLPVITDTTIVTEIASRVEKTLPEKLLLLPTLWPGSSHHHLGFPGTLSISSETYVRVLCGFIENLGAAGFRRVFLLNGHGGNQTPFAEALFRISLKQKLPLVAAQSYWKLAAREIAEFGIMQTPALSHACEYETSMMLALRPDLVKMDLAKGACPGHGSEFYDPLDYRPSRVVVRETFDSLSPTGALGSPELASEEKGRKLLDTITPVVVAFVQEFAKWPLPMENCSK